MKKKINDIIAFILASLLTFLVFNINLEPPKVKTIKLNDVVGVTTLTQEELKKLIKAPQSLKVASTKNLKRRKKTKRRKYKKHKYRSKRKKRHSRKYKKRYKKVRRIKKTKLASAKASTTLKAKYKRKNEHKVLRKTVTFSVNENEKIKKVPGIPISYLELLRQIIRYNTWKVYYAYLNQKNINDRGDVLVKFGLNKYGRLIYLKILKSPSPTLSKITIQALKISDFPPFPPDLKYDEVYFIVKIKYDYQLPKL